METVESLTSWEDCVMIYKAHAPLELGMLPYPIYVGVRHSYNTRTIRVEPVF